MGNQLTKEFETLKQRYSENSEERMAIITDMQNNLKKRTIQKTIKALDGKLYNVNSGNVEELYAIDGFLRSKETSDKNNAIAENNRERLLSTNKYSKENPYQN